MIPLLNFPYVVAEEIFKTMSPNEIFFLSLLSKQMRKYIKSSFPKRSASLEFNVESTRIVVESVPDRNRVVDLQMSPAGFSTEQLNPSKLGTETLRCTDGEAVYPTNGNVTSEIALVVIGHLLEYLNKPIVEQLASYSFSIDPKIFLESIQLFKKEGVELQRFFVCVNEKHLQAYKEILDKCSNIQALYIKSKVPGFLPPTPLTNQCLLIDGPSDWLKFADIKKCDIVNLQSYTGSLQDLVLLLKKTLATECQLEIITIQLNDVGTNLQTIIEELSGKPFAEVWNGRKLYAEFVHENGNKVKILKRGKMLTMQRNAAT